MRNVINIRQATDQHFSRDLMFVASDIMNQIMWESTSISMYSIFEINVILMNQFSIFEIKTQADMSVNSC